MNNREARETIENLCTVDEVSIVETDIEALRMATKALDREDAVLNALEDVKAEIISLSDKADQECKVSNSYSVRDRLRAKAQAYDDVAKLIDQKIKEINGKDCRDCKKWNDCECGKNGHDKGTSIGYFVGECGEYEVTKNDAT